MKPRTRKPTQERLQASQRFQQPLPAAPADKTPENGVAGTTGPVQQCLDNQIIQSLLEDLMDGAEIEVRK